MPVKIDAHQHFWKYSAEAYPWITDELAKLKRDFLPEMLRPLLGQNGFKGCVAVQARQTEEETAWLLALANQHTFIHGVIGWTDLLAGKLEECLYDYARHPKLKGFRHVLQDEDAESFLQRRGFIEGLSLLRRHNFTFDVLVYAHQLPFVAPFLERLEPMRLILDHIAKPDIASGEWGEWAEFMRRLGRIPHLYCKVSGLVSQAGVRPVTRDLFARYIDHALECFGPARIVFGSDWPVCVDRANYETVVGFIQDHLVTSGDRTGVMGENAVTFYALDVQA